MKTLAVLPSFTGIRRANGKLVLAGRFMSGMAGYAKYWDGRLMAIVEPEEETELSRDQDRTLGGDNVDVDPSCAGFDIELLDYDDHRALGEAVSRADVVVSGVHYRQNHLAKIGNEVGVPVVYAAEYTLTTRLQIVVAQETSPFRRAKRIAWEIDQERRIRAGVKRAAGVQCNGTPTYEAYRHVSKNPLLFFDGRGTEAMLVPRDDLERRLAVLEENRPLRLVFAGRMNHMKGAGELLKVAQHLLALGVPFSLDIFGGGVLEEPMRETVARGGMGHAVRMHGYVPFPELMPRMGKEWDIFLCCHVQGDPSGMYLEMLGKGLPFVGYANEALAGILRRTNVGRVVPVRDAFGAAQAIEQLAQDRRQIAFWSRAARTFGEMHTYDRTFQRRVDHLRGVL